MSSALGILGGQWLSKMQQAPVTLICTIGVLLKQSRFVNGLCRDSLFYALGKGEYWNVEDDCIRGIQFPWGLKGIMESVNCSLI